MLSPVANHILYSCQQVIYQLNREMYIIHILDTVFYRLCVMICVSKCDAVLCHIPTSLSLQIAYLNRKQVALILFSL